MDFKKLSLQKFGELLQHLYDVELNFNMKWMWDGGFDWSFEYPYLGSELQKPNLSIQYLCNSLDLTNLEVIGGLIIHEYLHNYCGLDSDGNPNKMHNFLTENGYLKGIPHGVKIGSLVKSDNPYTEGIVVAKIGKVGIEWNDGDKSFSPISKVDWRQVHFENNRIREHGI